MSVLVTGAAGFIGMHVADRLLDRGDQVVGIDNLNDYYPPQLKQDRLDHLRGRHGKAFEFLPLELADADGLRQGLAGHAFDRIIHLAAQPGVRYSLENPAAYIQSNLVGHANMIELARQREVHHFLYASSSSVYGGNSKLPFSVDDPVERPLSLYASTKRADELLSETYAHLYRVPMTGLRFFTVYGPWGRPDMAPWRFTEAVLTERPIQVFNHGRMRRDFTFIEDIVSGVVACLDGPPADDGEAKPGGSVAPHSLYNIGNNRPVELLYFIEVIERACGRKALLEMAPMQPGEMDATYADIEAMRRQFGFEPRTGIEEGVPKFVEWFRKYRPI